MSNPVDSAYQFTKQASILKMHAPWNDKLSQSTTVTIMNAKYITGIDTK